MITSGIESTPSLLISKIVRLHIILKRGARENTRAMNSAYLPMFDIDLVKSIFFMDFHCKNNQFIANCQLNMWESFFLKTFEPLNGYIWIVCLNIRIYVDVYNYKL